MNNDRGAFVNLIRLVGISPELARPPAQPPEMFDQYVTTPYPPSHGGPCSAVFDQCLTSSLTRVTGEHSRRRDTHFTPVHARFMPASRLVYACFAPALASVDVCFYASFTAVAVANPRPDRSRDLLAAAECDSV